MKSVGRMSITLEKEKEKKWSGLLDPKNPKVKHGVWDAMQERLDKEHKEKMDKLDAAKKDGNKTNTTDSSKKSSKKKKKKTKKSAQKEEPEDSDDDDESNVVDDDCELPNIYTSSKVKALCQKNFDRTVAKTGPWLIKFFDEHPSRQKQTHEMVHIWKHLAGTLPEQHCRIGVVDCKKDKNLCNQLKVGDKLPIAMRYAEAGAEPILYEGEIQMEQLAQFAVRGEQTPKSEL
jgi:hypothetical protein